MSKFVMPDIDYGDLASRILRDGARMKDRLTGARLHAQDEKGMAVIWRNIILGSCEPRASHPTACAFLWETGVPECLEVGSVWVHVEYRRNGYAQEVISHALELAPEGVTVILFTSELSIMKATMRTGFMPVTRAVIPNVEEWFEQLGIRERLPESALSIETPEVKDGVRWLFMRKK